MPEQGLVLVSNTRGDEIVVVDEDTHKPLLTAYVSAMPFVPTVDPRSDAERGRFFLIGLQSFGKVTVFTVERSEWGLVDLEVEQTFSSPCALPSRVVLGADPDTAYLLCHGEIAVLDSQSLAVKRVIDTGVSYPTDIVWSSY